MDPPIIARIIRFIPHSKLPKFVCIRVEIYGCTWKGEYGEDGGGPGLGGLWGISMENLGNVDGIIGNVDEDGGAI